MMRSVHVTSKDDILTRSVNKSRDNRVVCAVKKVVCGVFVMLSAGLYLLFNMHLY